MKRYFRCIVSRYNVIDSKSGQPGDCRNHPITQGAIAGYPHMGATTRCFPEIWDTNSPSW
jgi:hypothetical protein